MDFYFGHLHLWKQRGSFRGVRHLWIHTQYGAIQPAISLDISTGTDYLFNHPAYLNGCRLNCSTISPLQSSPRNVWIVWSIRFHFTHFQDDDRGMPDACQTDDCVKASLQAYLHDTWSKRCCLWAQIEELSWQRCLNLGWRVGTGGRQSQRSTSISQSGIHELSRKPVRR